MSELFEKLKKPMIVIAILIGGYIIYSTFMKKDAPTSLLKKDMVAGVKGPEDSLLPLLLKIQNVTLDEKLFLDPVFRALVDRSQNIVPENIGKPNPFSGTITSNVTSSVESLGFIDETSNIEATSTVSTLRR
jgi:hypothetical protein